MILLITEELDPTADHVILKLRARGLPFLRWNLDAYPWRSALSYRAGPDGFGGTIESDGRVASFADISAVWCRAYRSRGFPADLDPEVRKFAENEANMAYDALARAAPWRWVNHPAKRRQASWKPAQLEAARRLGFTVPRTLISNSPPEIRAFQAELGGPMIYKPLTQGGHLGEGQAIFTGVVTPDILANLDLIRHTPGIFQELVPKAHELRITVVGERLFTVKILSQAHAAARLDWRRAPYAVAYEIAEVPEDVRARILAFMAEFEIVYSCLDFIVTPDGGHVFLESNPGGQFLWIEVLTGLPIAEAIIDLLAAA